MVARELKGDFTERPRVLGVPQMDHFYAALGRRCTNPILVRAPEGHNVSRGIPVGQEIEYSLLAAEVRPMEWRPPVGESARWWQNLHRSKCSVPSSPELEVPDPRPEVAELGLEPSTARSTLPLPEEAAESPELGDSEPGPEVAKQGELLARPCSPFRARPKGSNRCRGLHRLPCSLPAFSRRGRCALCGTSRVGLLEAGE